MRRWRTDRGNRMKVLNFGSLNIDQVYSVDHILKGGETLSSEKLKIFPGGKGLNQSIALARAGVQVFHAGTCGDGGEMLLELCRENGVDTRFIRRVAEKNGHTVIQVDRNGQNGILLFGGSNQMQTREHIDEVLSHFAPGDMLLLQNEINLLDYIIARAAAGGMTIVLNPSPFDSRLSRCEMDKVAYFLVNEVEAEQMTGETCKEAMPEKLLEKYPHGKFILTLGSEGSVYKDADCEYRQGIFPVKAVDTTAAGDTYTGYFLASLLQGKSVPQALETAAAASALAVSRPGASSSIPLAIEVEKSLKA